MLTDLTIARLCAAIEEDAPAGFDYVDNGAETGVVFGIVRGPDNDSVIFRGSKSEEDWWRDAHTEMVSLPTVGLVHSGAAKNILLVAAKIKTMIKPNPIIGGHSLGAMHAAIYGGLLTSDIHEDPLQIVLFGCPRPGAAQLVKCLQNINVVSYKNRHDPVTDVPIPLPNMPYEHVRPFSLVDGLVDHSLGPFFEDHHMDNYIEGMLNAKLSSTK